MPAISHAYVVASGPARTDCHWLAVRFPTATGFDPHESDCWIGQGLPDRSSALMSQRGWITGLWRTEGRVWASESSGRLYVNPSLAPREAPFRTIRIDATLTGVWGLRDDLAFTWGLSGGRPVAFRCDGHRVTPIEVPGTITAVHGTPDAVWAVGHRGLLARLDGDAFRAVPSPTDSPLSDVFVAGPDEVYATSLDGDLLRGTRDGFERVLRFDGPLHCVARWHDAVWVGADDRGLLRLDGARLESVKPKLRARRLDARHDLVITAPDMIGGTSNGVDFKATLVVTFADLSARSPLPR